MPHTKQLTFPGRLYAQIDMGLLRDMGALRVPTNITAYLLYCHLNSSRKPWFFAESVSRPAFKVADRTLRTWLDRMAVAGVIELDSKKTGRWPYLKFNLSDSGIPVGHRFGPRGVIERMVQ